eukprot:14420752-Alexandrium_andersonii.AAC.1
MHNCTCGIALAAPADSRAQGCVLGGGVLTLVQGGGVEAGLPAGSSLFPSPWRANAPATPGPGAT